MHTSDTALVLADGRWFSGNSFGASPPTASELADRVHRSESALLRTVGEVVFNTAMSGYAEVLTDPSYTGQIVAMTYPHIGNYGVSDEWSECGPTGGQSGIAPESPRGASPARTVSVAGFVVRELYDGPVPEGRERLDTYLSRHGVPGITGLDTRALTLHLRRVGAQNGVIVQEPSTDRERSVAAGIAAHFPPMEGRGLLAEVGTHDPVVLSPPGDVPPGPHLALYDCGAKANIVRELHALGCTITIVPSTATAEEILATGAEAVLLSNGPGDPAVLEHQVAQARSLIGRTHLLGICLGHQILAEAAGAKTGKMKFGHHGVNHPVRDEFGGRVFVTSQNHGFAVEESTLPDGMNVWFRNANDGTIEGLRDESRGIRTTQFHPESAPGPGDSRWIFAAFLEGVSE